MRPVATTASRIVGLTARSRARSDAARRLSGLRTCSMKTWLRRPGMASVTLSARSRSSAMYLTILKCLPFRAYELVHSSHEAPFFRAHFNNSR